MVKHSIRQKQFQFNCIFLELSATVFLANVIILYVEVLHFRFHPFRFDRLITVLRFYYRPAL